MKPEHKPRIGNVSAGLMVGIAFFILDPTQILITFVPALGWILSMFVGFIAVCLYGIWFLVLGINPFKGRLAGVRIASIFAGFVIEMIPILDALPMITASVTGIIVSSRIEDRIHPNTKTTTLRKGIGTAGRGGTNALTRNNVQTRPGRYSPPERPVARKGVAAARFMPRRIENLQRKPSPSNPNQQKQAA